MRRKAKIDPGELGDGGVYRNFAKYYDMGRKFHRQGHRLESCDCVLAPVNRGWARAGYIDADIEQGNNKYFGAAQ